MASLLAILVLVLTLTGAVHAQAFLWGKTIGGLTGDLDIELMEKDPNGNLYLAGVFGGTADFDPGPGVYNMTANGLYPFYLLKLDANGNFLWARLLGTSSYALAIDSTGNEVYYMGPYYGTRDFDPGPGTLNLTSAGSSDIGITKFDAAGNFIWAKSMGGSLAEQAHGARIDPQGNLVLSGFFQGTADLDPGPGTANFTSAGGNDVAVLKLSSAGNLVWAKAMGGTGTDVSTAVTLDDTGNVYYIATYTQTADFDPGPGVSNFTSSGSRDLIISKLDSNGNFQWARSIGGTGDDHSEGLAIGVNGEIYWTGGFRSTADLDPGPATLYFTSAGTWNGFLIKLTTSGNLIWADHFQSNGSLGCVDIGLDSMDNVFVTGGFDGTADFDPGAGTFNRTIIGYYDAYIAALDSAGNFRDAWQFGADSSVAQGYQITVLPGAEFIGSGYFRDTIDLNPGPATDMHYTGTMLFNGYILEMRICQHSSASITTSNCLSYTSPSGNHAWTASGTYMDTIPNVAGCDSVLTIHLTITPGPNAAFSTTSSFQTATFTYQGTGATSWSWDFGDGNISTTQNPIHTYSAYGTYTVCLTVTDSICSATLCQAITVQCPASSATITPITCDSYTAPSGNFTWTTSGTYMDTIPTAEGCDSLITVLLTIHTSPTAAFSIVTNLLAATFSDQSTGGATSWAWDFGDGNTSTTQNPTHTYAGAGTYNVCLIATANGCSDTVCQSVTVLSVGMKLGDDLSVSIFPNPSNGKFQVRISQDLEAQVSDLQGRVILRVNFANGFNNLDLSGYPDGVYFLQLMNTDSKVCLKLSKLATQ